MQVMSEKDKQRNGVITRGPLPLLLYGANSHPSEKVRKELWKILDRWLEGFRPQHSPSIVREAILGFKGTFLEPFKLDSKNLRIATFLIRLAFSSAGGQTRIRINSALNSYNCGGLVMTHNLRGYYVEMLACGDNTKSPRSLWAFNPGLKPTPRAFPPMLPAQGWIGDQGFEASIDLGKVKNKNWLPESLVFEKLLEHSFLMNNRKNLRDLGIKVSVKNKRLHLSIANPELMIKLGPKICSGEGVKIKLKKCHINNLQPFIQLGMQFLEEEPKPITAQLVLEETDLGGWVYTDFLFCPKIPMELQRIIEKWLPVSSQEIDFYNQKAA